MPRTLYLDTGPLGLACNLQADRGKEPARFRARLADVAATRTRVLIPATADYELRRELVRADLTDSIAELDAIESGRHPLFPRVTYLPLTDAALKRAARLWAEARNRGYSTAQDKALDGDVSVVAQALEDAGPSGRFAIITGNVQDLAWYVGRRRARSWVDVPVH